MHTKKSRKDSSDLRKSLFKSIRTPHNLVHKQHHSVASADEKFLSASPGSGAVCDRYGGHANLDELFVVAEENGGVLQSGEPVRLSVHNGYVTLDAADDLFTASAERWKTEGCTSWRF